MADNVAITAGVGTVIRTEEQGGAQVQVIAPGHRLTSPYSEVPINVAASGDNIIVAAGAAGIKTRLYGFFLVSGAAVDVKWRDGTTDYHPVVPLVGRGAYWFLPIVGYPYFGATSAGALALNLNLSAAVQVSGRAYYISAA